MSALQKEIGIDRVLAKLEGLERAVAELSVDNRPEWYTIGQVADHLGRSRRTVQRKINRGEIEATERHGERMIHRDQL